MGTENKNNKVGIIKSERKIAKDGSGYTEKIVNIYGNDLEEVYKIFKVEWKNE